MSKENNLAGNDPHLTDAEREALQGFDENGNEIKADAAAEVPPVEKPPVADPDKPADEVPAVAADAEPVKEELPETPAAPNALTTVHLNAGDPRDFKAELKSLKDQYAKGEIDDEAYEERADDIKRASWKSEIREDLEQAQWQLAESNFLQDPTNALLLRSGALQAGWLAAMQTVANKAAAEGRWPLDNTVLMREGRDLLYQEAGLSGNAAAVAPPAPAVAAQKPTPTPPKLDALPPNIGQAPGAAPNGAKETAESLASKNIFEVERTFASMTDAQADQMLRQVAGGFAE